MQVKIPCPNLIAENKLSGLGIFHVAKCLSSKQGALNWSSRLHRNSKNNKHKLAEFSGAHIINTQMQEDHWVPGQP